MKLSNIKDALRKIEDLAILRGTLKVLTGKAHANAQNPIQIEISSQNSGLSKELQQISYSLCDEIRPLAISLIKKRISEISGELSAMGFEDDTDSEAV